mgnify:CR=1 FL=1
MYSADDALSFYGIDGLILIVVSDVLVWLLVINT